MRLGFHTGTKEIDEEAGSSKKKIRRMRIQTPTQQSINRTQNQQKPIKTKETLHIYSSAEDSQNQTRSPHHPHYTEYFQSTLRTNKSNRPSPHKLIGGLNGGTPNLITLLFNAPISSNALSNLLIRPLAASTAWADAPRSRTCAR